MLERRRMVYLCSVVGGTSALLVTPILYYAALLSSTMLFYYLLLGCSTMLYYAAFLVTLFSILFLQFARLNTLSTSVCNALCRDNSNASHVS